MSTKRVLRRVLTAAVAVVAVLALVGVGSWAYLTRARGTAQAVEFTDAQLSPQMTGARVLALGEATHGNAEFQQLRTTLVQKTVGNGFHTVVLEEDYGHTHEVNAFIQGGPGTAAEAANRFGFRINKTTQVAEWLQWMRDHNASVPADQRITLLGMDSQRTSPSLTIVADALKTADPAAAERARAAAKKDSVDRPTVDALTAAVAKLPASTARHDAEIAAASLRDYLDLENAGGAWPTVRDKAMFAHLQRYVGEAHGGVLLFAHDGHVAKVANGALPDPVGAKAARQWGEKYRVIGTDFVHTTFLSGDGADRQEWSLTNRTPLRGMYAGTDVGYVDFSRTQGENRTLVDSTMPMGTAGESFTRMQQLIPFLHEIRVVPSQMYDGLILVDRAGPTTML